jgi:hypothetical protein
MTPSASPGSNDRTEAEMTRYSVELQTTISRSFEVEADSKQEAYDRAMEKAGFGWSADGVTVDEAVTEES